MGELREPEAIIAIVDDDPSVQRGLQRLIRSAGWKATTFASAQEFLARFRAESLNCVLSVANFTRIKQQPEFGVSLDNASAIDTN